MEIVYTLILTLLSLVVLMFSVSFLTAVYRRVSDRKDWMTHHSLWDEQKNKIR